MIYRPVYGRIRKMRNAKPLILLSLALLIATTSCGDGRSDSKERTPAEEFVDRYVNTLTTAPQKARDASGAASMRTETQKRMIEEGR